MNDDSLTVDKKTFQRIIEKQAKEIDEWMQFQKTWHEDYKFARQICTSQPKNQFFRRIQIRNFCAMVEAQIHLWKLLTQKFHRMVLAELNDAEMSVLHEEAHELDDKGNIQTKRLHLSMARNFIFSAGLFSKVFCSSKQIDFAKEGWVCVKEVFKVRDRLMHPKFARGVLVEDKEMKHLKLAEQWFFSEAKALFDSQKDFDEIHRLRKKPVNLN